MNTNVNQTLKRKNNICINWLGSAKKYNPMIFTTVLVGSVIASGLSSAVLHHLPVTLHCKGNNWQKRNCMKSYKFLMEKKLMQNKQ